MSQVYIPKEELWEAFMAKEPAHAEAFREIIEESETESIQNLKKWNEEIEKLEQEFNNNADASEKDEGESEDESIIQQYDYPKQYIIRQALAQKTRFSDPEQSAITIGKQIAEILTDDPSLFVFDDRVSYLKHIYHFSGEQGLALSTKAWENIDRLQDLTLLRALCLFSALKIDSQSGWRWRLFIFENEQYWNLLIKSEE